MKIQISEKEKTLREVLDLIDKKREKFKGNDLGHTLIRVGFELSTIIVIGLLSNHMIKMSKGLQEDQILNIEDCLKNPFTTSKKVMATCCDGGNAHISISDEKCYVEADGTNMPEITFCPWCGYKF